MRITIYLHKSVDDRIYCRRQLGKDGCKQIWMLSFLTNNNWLFWSEKVMGDHWPGIMSTWLVTSSAWPAMLARKTPAYGDQERLHTSIRAAEVNTNFRSVCTTSFQSFLWVLGVLPEVFACQHQQHQALVSSEEFVCPCFAQNCVF